MGMGQLSERICDCKRVRVRTGLRSEYDWQEWCIPPSKPAMARVRGLSATGPGQEG
jgi:hypothetical protein